MKRAMVDIEALGLRETSIVLSIAVVNIDDPEEQYYRKLDLTEQEISGRTMDISTVKWWMEQSGPARFEAFGPGVRANPADVAAQLLNVLETYDQIYACGTSYDFKILASFVKTYLPREQWPFWKEMDWRTMRNYFDKDGKCKPKFEGEAHNALADALHQIKYFSTVEDGIQEMAQLVMDQPCH